MPHTSRKKKNPHSNKRREIVDQDGWTRITTSSSTPLTVAPQDQTQSESGQVSTSSVAVGASLPLPMPASQGSSLESMRAQFAKIETRWQDTDLCRSVEQMLRERILTTGGGEYYIANCALFGTGSFCGDAVHWVDRHESAYFQLAAFRTVVRTIERLQGHVPQAYAQEPYYNDLDVLFLASLDVTKVDHPKGFELLDQNSFVYSPAAEQEVESQIVSRAPRIWLHRSFDHSLQGDKESISRFKRDYEQAVLPELDLKNFPFHGSVMWWRGKDDTYKQIQTE
ncbi:hypothetical protein FOPE_12312 [Fonsecaea pedrosoi]|nr:hypothetical protein FOPE_12312 [Fonsecaea pedrosoi]